MAEVDLQPSLRTRGTSERRSGDAELSPIPWAINQWSSLTII